MYRFYYNREKVKKNNKKTQKKKRKYIILFQIKWKCFLKSIKMNWMWIRNPNNSKVNKFFHDYILSNIRLHEGNKLCCYFTTINLRSRSLN